MKRRITVSIVALVAVLGSVGLAAVRKDALNVEPAPEGKHFLKVGKSYRFPIPGGELKAKVVEEPWNNWCKVRGENPKTGTLWLNLDKLDMIGSSED